MKIKLMIFLLVSFHIFSFSTKADTTDTKVPLHPPKASTAALKVMTRNLYVGFDAMAFLNNKAPAQHMPLLVAQALKNVQESKFHLRAQAIAEEVAYHNPHLIGLQEVSLFRRQSPGDFLIGNPKKAEDFAFDEAGNALDYLQILRDALAAKGLEYEVVSTVDNFDLEAPMFVGGTPTEPLMDDLRLTDRDVILKKVGIETRNPQGLNFTNTLKTNLSGLPINIIRGYNSVIAKVDGLEYQFVNAHLETNSNEAAIAIQSLQATELINFLNQQTELPIILLGDFNSAPDSGENQAYQQLKKAGLVDTWNLRANSTTEEDNLGYTCCYSDLKGSEATLSQRIDQVWFQFPSSPPPKIYVENLGASMWEGFWPSDHLGTLATFYKRP